MKRWTILVSIGLAIGLAGCSGDAPRTKAPTARVTAVSQNLLHGIACTDGPNRCDLKNRVKLFVTQLADAKCPELVGVQETNTQTVELLKADLKGVCNGRYEVVWDDDPGLDREVVLTTDRVLGSERIRLAGPLRAALWVRVAGDVGLIDFWTTHLASSSDDRPCDAASCPAPCKPADSLNTCQGRQVAAAAVARADDKSVVILGGDLNAEPGSPTIDAITTAGFLDSHNRIGNAECNPATGTECTSGRVDTDVSDLSITASRQTERIDYLLLVPAPRCRIARPTGLFAPDGSSNGPNGLVHPSDHTGVEMTVRCATTSAERRDAAKATVLTTTTTTLANSKPDAAATAAITAAFSTLFGGATEDVEQKLAVLEDADLLRQMFTDRMEQTKDVARRITVQIDDIALTGGGRAEVTYSLLLDGSVVLDHLPGSAILSGDQWLVTRRTFCDVGTQGMDTIPEPCRAP